MISAHTHQGSSVMPRYFAVSPSGFKMSVGLKIKARADYEVC